MQEGKFLKLIIVCLLILNMGTLAFLWFGGPEHRMPPRDGDGPPHHEDAGHYLNRSLQLTDEQEHQYRGMREAHHEHVMMIHDRVRGYKQNLYHLLASAASKDTMVIYPYIDSIAAAQREIELITYVHFRELRSICTSQQQQKFDQVIGEALERLR